MRVPTGNLHALTSSRGIAGPWPCESCGQLSQYAEVKPQINHVFCRNENCRYERIIDKKHSRIIENDGTVWEFYEDGSKRQIRMPGG